MRRLAVFVCLATVLFGQPTYTNIVDTIYTPVGGVLFSGTLQISNPIPMTATAGPVTISEWLQTIQIRNGVLNVRLVPNDAVAQVGTSYDFHFISSTGVTWDQYCTIPTSLSPVQVNAVCSSIPFAPPAGMAAGGILSGFYPAPTCPTCVIRGNNLSDLTNEATARTNLGLAAIAASGSASDLVAGTVPPARLPLPGTSTLGGVEANTSPGSNFFVAGIDPSTGLLIYAEPSIEAGGLAAIATSGSASDLVTGTVPPARLPNPTTSTLGGTEALPPVSHFFLTGISTSGVPTAAQPTTSDISGLAAIASSGSASDLVTGTVPAARLPNPTTLTLGGVEAAPPISGQFVTGISTAGVVTQAAVAAGSVTGLAAIATSGSASDLIAGTVPPARLPNPTAITLGGIESFAAVTHQWINTISTSGVPSATQPACGDLSNGAPSCSTDTTNAANITSGTLPAARLPNPSSTTLGGTESFAPVTHEWINTISTSGVPSATQPSCQDLSNFAASCYTDATNASNITSGTLGTAELPASVVYNNASNTFSSLGSLDLGSSAGIRIKTGLTVAIPPTCTVGQLFFASDAAPGQNIYECTSINTWTQQLVTNVTITGQANQISVSGGGCTGSGTCNIALANNTVIPGNPTIEGVTAAGATGTGNLVFSVSPGFTTPNIGAATGISFNGLTITSTTATLTIPSGVTLTGPPFSATMATLNLLNTFTGRQNATGANSTAPVKAGLAASIPGTCAQGDMYFATDAGTGQNLYLCSTANAWSAIVASAAVLPSILGTSNQITATGAGCTTSSGTCTIALAMNPVLPGHPTIEGTTSTGATGAGSIVFSISPTLQTPNIGAATATTINKVTITPVATGATLTIPDGVTMTGPSSSGTVATLNLLNTFTGRQNSTGAASTAPLKLGLIAQLPVTCGVGDLYFATDATAGQNIYECALANVWTQQLATGATIVGATNQIAVSGGGCTGAGTCTISLATNPIISGHPTIEGVTSTGATGTGNLVYSNSPTLVTPTLGAATATSINGLAITSTSSATLTIASGVTLTGPSASGTVATLNLLNTFTGRQDSSGAVSTTPAKTGLTSALPVTCIVGDLYFATDATAGRNLYECGTSNVWSQQVVGSGSTILGTANQISVTGSGCPASTGPCTIAIVGSPIIPGHPTIEGVTSSGATGTGLIVFATSPTLTTPNIGDATGIGLTFGIGGAGLVANGASRAAPFKTGLSSAIPSSCTTGDTYFETNASAGQNLYLCTATNTWTQLVGASGGAALPTNSLQTRNSGGNFAGYSTGTWDGTTLTLAPTGGGYASNSTQTLTLNSTTNIRQIVEPILLSLSGPIGGLGNFQAGYGTDVYAAGLSNPAGGGNIMGGLYRTSIFNGTNNGTYNKNTLGGDFFQLYKYAAGQAANLYNFTWHTGVGDAGGMLMEIMTSAHKTDPGDEGTYGLEVIANQDVTVFKYNINGITRSACAATSITAPITPASAAPGSVAVTVNSTTSCAVGDWMTIDNAPISGSTAGQVETVQLTAVSSGAGTVSAVWHYPHSTSAPLAPANKLLQAGGWQQGSGNSPGQGRIWIDWTSAAYTTGTATPTLGSCTITGSGTTWSTGMVSGTSNLVGAIYFPGDDITAFGNTYHMWYPIASVGSTTSLTIVSYGGCYSGSVSTSSSYVIRMAGRVGAISTTVAAQSETMDGVVIEGGAGFNSISTSATDQVEQIVSPQAATFEAALQCDIIYYLPGTSANSCIRTVNLGTQQMNSVLDVVANSVTDTPTTASFKDFFDLNANTARYPIWLHGQNLAASGLGSIDNGVAIEMYTYGTASGGIGDAKAFHWEGQAGSLATGRLLFELSTGAFKITQANSHQLKLLNESDSNSFAFDYTGTSSNPVLTIPNSSGTIALQNPGVLARTIPGSSSAPNNAVEIGSFTTAAGIDFSVTVTGTNGVNTAKKYHVSATYTDAPGGLITIQAETSSVSGGVDWALDVNSSTLGVYDFRLRRVDGGSTGASVQVVFVSLSGGNYTFTPSTTAFTESTPTTFWPSAVLEQAGGVVYANGQIFLQDVPPNDATKVLLGNGHYGSAPGGSGGVYVTGVFTSGDTGGGCTLTLTATGSGALTGCSNSSPTIAVAGTATHGWSCWMEDITNPQNRWGQSGNSNTAPTFLAPAISTSGDTVNFGCLPY